MFLFGFGLWTYFSYDVKEDDLLFMLNWDILNSFHKYKLDERFERKEKEFHNWALRVEKKKNPRISELFFKNLKPRTMIKEENENLQGDDFDPGRHDSTLQALQHSLHPTTPTIFFVY